MRLRGKDIFLFFVIAALYLSGMFGTRNKTTVFFAIITLCDHLFFYIGCSAISSYRLNNPSAKYIEIKNDFIRKMLVRPFRLGRDYSAAEDDNRINLIGLVLHIINAFLFICFETLLFLPKIPAEPYTYHLLVPKYIGFNRYNIILTSYNEIIAAEGPMCFGILVAAICFVVMFLFERRIIKQDREKEGKQTPPKKAPIKAEWYSPLCLSLEELASRKNNKKRKFWYEESRLGEIDALVSVASENAELKIENKKGKRISFTVYDTLNEHKVFQGKFI